MLLSLGADIDKIGKWGSELVGNPLQWAKKLGFDECIQIIMKEELERG